VIAKNSIDFDRSQEFKCINIDYSLVKIRNFNAKIVFSTRIKSSNLGTQEVYIHRGIEKTGIGQGGSPDFPFGASGLCPRQRLE